jgi:predicted  nucleic acid-binding Zn-ribbon protein
MTSQTNVTAEALRTLHRIHRQLNDLKERLTRGPQIVRAHRANVERLEAELAKLKEDAKSLRMATDDRQGQLASKEAALEKRRAQLRQAADNREFQALKDEIAATEAANGVLEVEILEGMEQLDEMNVRIGEAAKSADDAREEADKVSQEIENEGPRIRGDIERLQAELSQSEADLPGDFRELYRRDVRQRGEDALASVRGEFCDGCNQQVPVNLINDMMLNRPVTCRSCGRLLYLPEDYSPR